MIYSSLNYNGGTKMREVFNKVSRRWEYDLADARATFYSQVTVRNGVVRWHSNNAVPQPECLDAFAQAGCQFDMAASVVARNTDIARFRAEYRTRMAESKYNEELFALHEAFVQSRGKADP